MTERNLTIPLLNKIVLFICQDYIVRTQKDGGEIPPILSRLNGSITGFKQFHMFSIEEAKKVLLIAKEKDLLDIMDKEVSFLVFVMEVMKLWTQDIPKQNRPHLNISDKHFKLGGKMFWKQMMYLKKTDKENYIDKQDIIDTSIEVANEFYTYHRRLV